MKVKLSTLIIATVFIFSCVSTGPLPDRESDTPVYYGQGMGASANGALNAAKAQVVRRAADRLLGTAPATANREELDSLFSGDNDMNMFIVRDSLELISRSGEGDRFSASIKVRVDLNSLSGFLKSKDIIGGQVLPQGGKLALADEQKPVWATQAPPVETPVKPAEKTDAGNRDSGKSSALVGVRPEAVDDSELSEEDLARVREYVENLSFVVYFDTETKTDPFLMKAAVSSANKYLGTQGYQFRDLEQVERVREDQERAYEEETGKSVSMLQWIAAKLKADIYIEIAASVSSNSENSKHYGSASVTLNIFESATGNGLGQAYYQTNPPAFSTVSESDALNNAIASAVYKAMPEGIRIAEAGFMKSVSKGIAYELVFINTPNSRLMREFVKKMERKTKSIERTSYSQDETRYTVKYIGTVEELEFLVYDTAELVPGLEGMTMVLQRGNSMTFETGM